MNKLDEMIEQETENSDFLLKKLAEYIDTMKNRHGRKKLIIWKTIKER